MKIICLISTICIFLALDCFGQKGYKDGVIVFSNNDTVSAKISTSLLKQNKCVYFDLNGNKITGDVTGIKGFYLLNGKKYEVKRFDKSDEHIYSFFEVLVSGEISLFRYNRRLFVEKLDQIYELVNTSKSVQDKDGKQGDVQRKEYIGILRYLFSDKNIPVMDIDKLNYDNTAISQLVQVYNRGEKYLLELQSKKYKKQLDFGCGILLGFGTYRLEFPENEFNSVIDNNQITPGIETVLRYRFAEHFSWASGIECEFIKLNTFSSYKGRNTTYYYTLNHTCTNISVPVLFNYHFTQLPFLPTIGIGASIGKTINADFEYLKNREQNSSGIINSTRESSNFSEGINPDFIIELGCSPKYKRLQYDFKIRYKQHFPNNNTSSLDKYYLKSGIQLVFNIIF